MKYEVKLMITGKELETEELKHLKLALGSRKWSRNKQRYALEGTL